jgi:hypothetical protein
MISRRGCLAVAAVAGAALALAGVGCTNRASPNTRPAAPAEIDRVDLFVRNAAREFVELTLTRESRGDTVTWYVQRYDGRLRPIGPREQDTEMAVRLLSSFDIWALNAPDAPGAACRTVLGQRSCAITFDDYSLVMRVQRGQEVRVQRYTGLEKSTSNPSARALGDFVFEWARMREGRAGHSFPPSWPDIDTWLTRVGH